MTIKDFLQELSELNFKWEFRAYSNNQSEEWKVPATIRAYSNVKNLGYCCRTL